MELSRRELLSASALLVARPRVALSTAAASRSGPIVLCWNENPYGPSPAARASINDTIASGCRYPDEEIGELIDTLAAREHLSAAHIVTGTGSGELLCALGLIHGCSRRLRHHPAGDGGRVGRDAYELGQHLRHACRSRESGGPRLPD